MDRLRWIAVEIGLARENNLEREELGKELRNEDNAGLLVSVQDCQPRHWEFKSLPEISFEISAPAAFPRQLSY